MPKASITKKVHHGSLLLVYKFPPASASHPSKEQGIH